MNVVFCDCSTGLLPSRFGHEPNEDRSVVQQFSSGRADGHTRSHGTRGARTQLTQGDQDDKLPRRTVVPGQTYHQTSV